MIIILMLLALKNLSFILQHDMQEAIRTRDTALRERLQMVVS